MDNRVEDATVPRTSGLIFHAIEFNDAEPDHAGLNLYSLHLKDAHENGSYGRLLEPKTGRVTSCAVVVKCLGNKTDWVLSPRGGDFSDSFEPDLKKRPWVTFYREYAALKRIGHDYAPAVYAFGYVSQAEGCGTLTSPAIVMEKLGDEPDGTSWMSLRRAIESGAIYDDTQGISACIRVGKLLAAAVEHMRTRGILHHDISGNNVFLHIDEKGRIDKLRLIDFGQAARVDGTQTNMRPGTPSYAAPEMVVFNSKTPYLPDKVKKILISSKNNPGSDIWPIGAALYHVRTKKLPEYDCKAMEIWDDEGRAEVIKAKLIGLALEGDLSEADEKLNGIIIQCTRARAEDRPGPSDLIDMLSELDELLSRINARSLERTPAFRRTTSNDKKAEVVPPPNGNDMTPVFSVEAATGAPTNVVAAIYHVIGMANGSPKVLVLGASERGCHANGVRIDGARYPLKKEAVVPIPSNGWDHGACPWTEVERAYVRETIRPISIRGWFEGCGKLKSIRGLENIDTSLSKSMRRCFAGCSSLTSLDVSGWDVSAVEDLSACFDGCSSLTSLDVSGWDVSAAEDLSLCFADCSSLTSLDVSGWDVSSVTDMGSMFNGCSSLRDLDVSGWDVSSVKNYEGCFEGCSSLESSKIADWYVPMENEGRRWGTESTPEIASEAMKTSPSIKNASEWTQVSTPILRRKAFVSRTGVTVSYIGEGNRWGKYEVDGTVAYDVDIRSDWAPKKGELVLYGVGDSGLASILVHGYPHAPLRAGGDIDRFITQAAVWWYLRDCYGIGAISENFTKTDADPYNLRKLIMALVNQAKEARCKSDNGIYSFGGKQLAACLFALEGDDKPLVVSLANPDDYL